MNFSGVFNTLYIEQDATKLPTFLSDGPGTGTFAIPSVLHTSLTNRPILGTFVLSPFDSTQSANFTLTGRYNVSGPPGKATLELTGLQSVSLPLFNRGLALASGNLYGVTATFDLTGAALNFALNYRLTTQVAIPEPGSVLLMAIGLVSLTPVIARSRRRRQTN
jgi:hypothetical protein